MPKKEFAHLIKPLIVQRTPGGLYPDPQVWMESKDLEGFNALFSFGFIKEPRVFHPVEGMVVHPYDELLVFAGFQDRSILRLDAEVSILLGEEREEHVFSKPSVVVVPKGTPHGPVTARRVNRPIVHYSIGLAPEYRAATLPAGSKSRGSKYEHLIKPLITRLSQERTMTGAGNAPTYAQIMDADGVLHPAKFGVGPGNGDDIVWLFGDNVEGMDVNFTWGLYSQCGKWHRGGEAHTHPEAEILVFVGLDPNDINYLGAELELGMGKDYERHVFNKPTVAICPQGFPHLPLITRWVDKPYGFFVICLSGEHESPWVEA